MSEGLEKIEQIIDDIRSLENTRYLPLFNKRYAELLREIASKKTQSGYRQSSRTVISEEEKARRHKENLKRRPPGWSSLPDGRAINVKKNDKIPPNMPRDYGIDIYDSGPVNRRLSDWQEKDPDQRKWSVIRDE